MDKWSQKELLCNSRGLDDGYVYLHKDHQLSKATSFILTSGDEYTTKKFPLSDIDMSRISCFFGYLRKPLSNEIYDFDSNSIVPLPKTASRISRTTETFADPIEPNEALCFAFTEPTITSHKSVMLRGAVVPKSILTDEDRYIRRPRLNRGGTIANMGGANKSHQSGYGSMNISSYERDLAIRTGRGNQMNQAGTRTWGSMEPTPKHQRFVPPPPVQQAPMMQRWQAPPAFPPPPTAFPPPPPHTSFPPPPNAFPHPPPHPQMQQAGRYQQQQQGYQSNPGAYNQQTMRAIGQQSQQTQQRPPYQAQQRPPYQATQAQQQAQSGYSFRQAQPSAAARPGTQQQQQSGGRANLNNLRAQLLNTLQKNRQNK
jgi:hypothetical protein